MQILHVIGKVGAGKSHFIRQYCSHTPCFDIKTIYEEYQCKPVQLRQPAVYRQFVSALNYTMDGFFRQFAEESLVVIESSGINHALNQYLKDHHPILLYVKSSYSMNIAKERPYAETLNPIIERALLSKKFCPVVAYNGDTDTFDPIIPPIIN
jgi:hypothetical protein